MTLNFPLYKEEAKFLRWLLDTYGHEYQKSDAWVNDEDVKNLKMKARMLVRMFS